MRSKVTTWFECKVVYEKTMDNGAIKRITEQYVVDAQSFTEAEARITEEMSSYISGTFEVADIRKASYKEVFFADSNAADKWYKVKMQFITIDEKTEKEKRSTVVYLFNAGTISSAIDMTLAVMQGSVTDYVITAVTETMIMDVYES